MKFEVAVRRLRERKGVSRYSLRGPFVCGKENNFSNIRKKQIYGTVHP